MTNADCLLCNYVSVYAVDHDLADGSVYQLRRTAAIFEAWALLQQPIQTIDVAAITDDALSRFLFDKRTTYSQATLRKLRGDLLTLLRDAADRGLREPPKRVRKIAKPKPQPRAWRADQVALVIDAARQLPGTLKTGASRADYYTALLLVAWDTGLRRSDLFRIRQTDVDDLGRVVMAQKKTGDLHVAHVRHETLQLLRRLPGDRPLDWHSNNRLFYYWFRRCVDGAGVPYIGGLHALRRSGATDVARLQPGRQTQFLGHSTPTADAHYLDRRILDAVPILPSPMPLPLPPPVACPTSF